MQFSFLSENAFIAVHIWAPFGLQGAINGSRSVLFQSWVNGSLSGARLAPLVLSVLDNVRKMALSSFCLRKRKEIAIH